MDQIASSKSVVTSSFTVTNDINGKGSYSDSNDCSNTHNPLRSSGSSVSTFSKSGNSSRYLGSSSVNYREPSRDHANTKRTTNINSSFTLEPPFKKQNCVEKNSVSIVQKDVSQNSIRIVENYTDGRPYGTNKKLTESKSSTNNAIVNKALHSTPVGSLVNTSNLSCGLRYTQNTASSVLSPKLTNGEPEIVAQARSFLLRPSKLSSYGDNPTNTIPSTTSNTPKLSLLENCRKAESPVMAYFRRSTARKKRDNLKRFPGPAGLLPRLVNIISITVII